MHEYIDAVPGDSIFVTTMPLEVCQMIKLKPESCDFYEIVAEGEERKIVTQHYRMHRL
jgi:hypothetical protein